MICSKNLVYDIKDVPQEWIWMNYCNLWKESFDGASYTIHSIFKTERTPSMKIYFREGKDKKEGKYRFRCYSTGISGDEVELVKKKFDLSYWQACLKIVEDYNNWIVTKGGDCTLKISDFKRQRFYNVNYLTRGWNELDKKFWLDFKIGSKVLSHFNVMPLEWFSLMDEENEFTISGEYIYGYFNNKGELFKIYQPKVAKRKFIYVSNHLQGFDQLMNENFLMIQSGLKDIMSSYALKMKIDYIAPHSENTMIKQEFMEEWLGKYKRVLIMLDNDEAGHRMMERYVKQYPKIVPIYHCIEGCKDTAEIVRKLGIEKARNYFVPLINKNLCTEMILDRTYRKEILSLFAEKETLECFSRLRMTG